MEATPPLLAQLLSDINECSSSVDPWETNSSRSTITGLGSLAGRAIMNLGIGVIQVAQYVKERTELARIAAEQERSGRSLSLQAYHDIVEYQRFVSVQSGRFL